MVHVGKYAINGWYGICNQLKPPQGLSFYCLTERTTDQENQGRYDLLSVSYVYLHIIYIYIIFYIY